MLKVQPALDTVRLDAENLICVRGRISLIVLLQSASWFLVVEEELTITIHTEGEGVDCGGLEDIATHKVGELDTYVTILAIG